jgi:hypothetical protein
MRTAEYPKPFDDHEHHVIRCGLARGECIRTTADRISRRAADVARQRIDMGLSEHEEFLGAAPLPPLSQELLSM